MTKASWGAKRACPGCSARFYDLGKNPAKCPKCGTMHDITAPVKTRRGRSKAVAVAAPAAKPVPKADTKVKPPKPVKEIEDIDLEEFEDIETLDTEEEIEEIEEIEDVENIEGIEEIGDAGAAETTSEEAAVIEKEPVGATVLIDEVDESDDEGEAEDEEEKSGKRAAAKPKKKAKK